jgi:hypothetical protein
LNMKFNQWQRYPQDIYPKMKGYNNSIIKIEKKNF